MIKIVWIGFHEEGIEAFKETLENKNNVSAFITLNDSSYNRRSAGSRLYADYCKKYNVPYYTVSTIKGEDAYTILNKYQPDLLVVMGWSEILPARLLRIPRIGTVGTHAALLPHNRGSAPINWAIIHGEKETGNTMMWLDEQVDEGKIIDQSSFPITLYDSCKTLYDKVAVTNAVMLNKLLAKLEIGEEISYPITNKTNEPLLPRRQPKDGKINWNQNGEDIYNFIRALTKPYPGAFTFLNGKKYFVWKAALLPIPSKLMTGEIVGSSIGFEENTCGIVVSTLTVMLLITEIEDEEGKLYSGRELSELSLKGVFRDE